MLVSSRVALRRSLSVCSWIVVCSVGLGQAPGVSPGFRLLDPVNSTTTYLIDTNGAIVHSWPSAYLPGVSVRMLDDGSLLRSIRTGTLPDANIGGTGGAIQRVAFDGTVLWEFHYQGPGVMSHHDIHGMPNGNVLMIAWEDKTVAQAIAAGRNPAFIAGNVFRPDHVIEVQPTPPLGGTIVWEWHAWDHLIQDFDPARANFGVVAAHPELIDINLAPDPAVANDWNHVNGIDYDPAHDWIVLSAPRQNEVWILDHGTTTAEAAGHTGGARGKGGDLLYRWGNPQAYGAGTAAAQQLFFQHGPQFIPQGSPGAGHLLVFNNQAPGGTSVVELALPLDAAGNFVLLPGSAFGPAAPSWSYSAPGFQSSFVSNAERLPNGNTLICSGMQGRIFEVTAAGQEVWSYSVLGPAPVTFHAHYIERRLWASESMISSATGGSVGMRVVAGTDFAWDAHLLLASASGTAPGIAVNGQLLPLNYDDLLVYTFTQPNSANLVQTSGYLGFVGEAASTVIIPPGLLGLNFHVAYAVFDWATAAVVATTNAVPITIGP